MGRGVYRQFIRSQHTPRHGLKISYYSCSPSFFRCPFRFNATRNANCFSPSPPTKPFNPVIVYSFSYMPLSSDLALNMTLLILKAIADLIVPETIPPGNLISKFHTRFFSFLGSLERSLRYLSCRIMEPMISILLNLGQNPNN